MAWPCISRVCCLARFWSQMDKSDLAVPLTIHNYSDIEEPAEDGADAPLPPPPAPRIPTGGPSTLRPQPPQPRPAPAPLPSSASAPSLQQHENLKRPSKKATTKKTPFAAETQYQQDFRAWPLQKRDALPWVGESRGRLESAIEPPAPSTQAGILGGSQPHHHHHHVYVLPMAGQEGPGATRDEGCKQGWSSSIMASSPPKVPKTTSYRHEYRPWTGAKRSRPTKTTQGFIIPEDHFTQESSYKADFKIPEVKAKFSPNPSAVFQAPSRILNV
ncbi:MAP6 domain-containing protein 1 [Sceloporus undulatus]|uniref:MAP6 domain-containing protein 1 n=1 Tax=Sceloporus undulatus TaxID=8520 RepID=UPI001C4B0065|nr:MAP6 domain-containing protein 1 [Sceloporus undulatus]